MEDFDITLLRSMKPGRLSTPVVKKRNAGDFVRKYFFQGQNLDERLQAQLDEIEKEKLPFHERYRKFLALFLPFLFFQVCWWTIALKHDLLPLFWTRYEMSVTMIFGSFLAGATSEGGGAVAFPVMTLLLKIPPKIARDFSLMIQSCGMSACSFTILFMKIKLEWHSIIFCSLGATLSVILSLEFLDDAVDNQEKKMIFVSIWFAFAVALLMLNLQRKRQTFDSVPNFGPWKALVLVVTGMFGGLLSAWTGSGIDICSFSVLTLLFRVSEKVATPTSVILMWLNTWVGFYWRHLIQGDISPLAWEYFTVAVPVAVTMAPLGSLCASFLHRQVLACSIYVLETVALLGFLATGPAWRLIIIGAFIIVIASISFWIISRLGKKLCDRIEADLSEIRTPSSSGSTAYTVEKTP
ncbi:unnamed protein product [Bursaphelenchus xylophilus]|uniref:(pine wood nematode) hypothetical protein n=1 Tax=Bursaphelenchus xylophilus TaxID=6326 RepID=A0A1I7RJ43_BURXY|nr:unnamed protein product [Bursaphelenchus xylophilus]CAG9119337.1 unnamed protein product [Bursaphelenchus xylophilus]